jgi:hypothetical protein
MKKIFLAAVAMFIGLTGCVPVDSLNPLYTKADLVFDEALGGQWVVMDSGDERVLVFTPFANGKDGRYILTVDAKDADGKRDVSEYLVHLLNIKGHQFLDLVQTSVPIHSSSYALRIRQSKAGTTIVPRLLQLSIATYMEFTGGPKPEVRLRPAHWFFKVWIDGTKLRLDGLDETLFRQAVDQRKFRIASTVVKEHILITASTRDLQRFVLDHVDDENPFSQHLTEMTRKAP